MVSWQLVCSKVIRFDPTDVLYWLWRCLSVWAGLDEDDDDDDVVATSDMIVRIGMRGFKQTKQTRSCRKSESVFSKSNLSVHQRRPIPKDAKTQTLSARAKAPLNESTSSSTM